MQTIGERLEEARKRKGISIREAAEATKIRGDYLQKFEANQYDINLPEIYVRGFLRTYATLLKVPADKIMADYKALGLGADSRPRTPNREVYGRMDISFASSNGKASSGGEEGAAIPMEEGSGESGSSRPRQFARIGTSLPNGPYIDPRMITKAGLIAAGAVLVVLLIWGLSSLFAGKSGGSSSAAAGEAATELTLCALDQVRVKVVQVSDKAELFQGTLSAGERKTLLRRGSVYVTTTSGKSLKVEMNGKRYDLPFDGYDRAEVGVR